MDALNKSTPDTAEPAHEAQVKAFPNRAEPGAAPTVKHPVAEPYRKRRSPVKIVIGGLVVAAILGFGGREAQSYWSVGRFMVTTDDAYLQADITVIAPRVQGYVQQIEVAENQHVTAGDVLMRLDDGDYKNALRTAQSQVATQVETVTRIDAQADAARAAVTVAEAQKASAEAVLRNAQSTADRVLRLAQSSIAAQAQLDDATAALAQAHAAVTGAQAQIEAARANVAVLVAQGAEARSQMQSLTIAVDQARRNLDLTVLRAPVSGIVANLAVRAGDLVSNSQSIAAVVPVDAIYVEANYKETQLADIAPGAFVRVTIDALEGQSFEGRVTSVAPATGAQFSLLPAENATGNFTKIVQRVPVRISLSQAALDSGALHAGLSVTVEIDRRTLPDRN